MLSPEAEPNVSAYPFERGDPPGCAKTRWDAGQLTPQTSANGGE